MRFGTLFSGIGGPDLAAESLGIETAWSVEVEEYPAKVLALRFPDAERLTDVREVSHPPHVDGMAGGFPCQDLSLAGRGRGIGGSRSGLYSEYMRIIGEVGPEFVLIENVPALLHRGMELVVENLVELGYGVEWDCLPAAAFGAPHLRDRVWIVAHKLGAPVIFGQPAALFATPPAAARDLVGGDEDDDEALSEWMKWPRAGWVEHDPTVVMPLEPLARISDAKRGRSFLPTPEASDGTGGRNESKAFAAVRNGQRTAYRPSGAKASLSLRTAVEILGDGELLPTPVANDVKGGVVSHIRNKNGHDAARREKITSLAVLARNDFREATPEQVEEAHRTAADTERAGASGWTPGDDLVPTPMAADGERQSEQGVRHYTDGSDNPTLLGAARRLDGTPIAGDLLPTPTAEGYDATKFGDGNPSLLTAAEARDEEERESFPTPTVNDSKNLTNPPSQFERKSLGLPARIAADEERKLWPTAVASDALGSRRATARTEDWTSNPGETLLDAVSDAEGIRWATPKASPSGPDYARAGRDGSGGDDLATQVDRTEKAAGSGGQLNPAWVEWLMGFPVGWTDLSVANEDLLPWAWEQGEPEGVPRVSVGTIDRRHRLKALGNSLVPRAPEWIIARYLAAKGRAA